LTLILAIGTMPYVYAYVKSGSPVFPFNNDTFHSTQLENTVVDRHLNQPLSWFTPADLTFQTHLYLEAQDGSFGFQYLLFLPLLLIVLFGVRSYGARSAAIIGLAAAILVLVN